MNGYTFMGSLLNGESIFFSKADGLAIEKDHMHLVAATQEKKDEIYKTKSHLREIIRIQKKIEEAPHENALADH